MKKIHIGFLCFGLVLLCAVLLGGCSAELGHSREIEKQLDITLPAYLSQEYADDHGGFHGDGRTVAKIAFAEAEAKDLAAEIKKSGWRELPLSENLSRVMYSGTEESLAAQAGIPEMTNGHWWFVDRHSESTSPQDDTEVSQRSSYNFTLGLFDGDSGVLYYFKFDT